MKKIIFSFLMIYKVVHSSSNPLYPAENGRLAITNFMKQIHENDSLSKAISHEEYFQKRATIVTEFTSSDFFKKYLSTLDDLSIPIVYLNGLFLKTASPFTDIVENEDENIQELKEAERQIIAYTTTLDDGKINKKTLTDDIQQLTQNIFLLDQQTSQEFSLTEKMPECLEVSKKYLFTKLKLINSFKEKYFPIDFYELLHTYEKHIFPYKSSEEDIAETGLPLNHYERTLKELENAMIKIVENTTEATEPLINPSPYAHNILPMSLEVVPYDDLLTDVEKDTIKKIIGERLEVKKRTYKNFHTQSAPIKVQSLYEDRYLKEKIDEAIKKAINKSELIPLIKPFQDEFDQFQQELSSSTTK